MHVHDTDAALQGIFYTCKLGDKLWSEPSELLDELEAIKVRLRSSADFVSMEYVQLLTNRQELLLLGVTREGATKANMHAGEL